MAGWFEGELKPENVEWDSSVYVKFPQSLKAHRAGASPDFSNVKRNEWHLTSPGQDAGQSQVNSVYVVFFFFFSSSFAFLFFEISSSFFYYELMGSQGY